MTAWVAAAAIAATGGAIVATTRAGAAGAPAAAATLSVPAAADTYVVKESPDTAYGTATKVTASRWTTWNGEAYLRFAVPAAPAGSAYTGARLQLTLSRTDHLAQQVEVRSLTGGWTEASTYATRPAAGSVLATAPVPAGATSLSIPLPTPAAGSLLEVGLTVPTSRSAASFASREAGTSGPELELAYGGGGTGGTGTLCGISAGADPGESYQHAFDRLDARYGGVGMVRVFYPGLPAAWPGKLDAGDRPLHVSFKALPRDVLAGRYDAQLRSWFAAAPPDRTTWWTYYHEPEDDIARGSFTAADYRAAWAHLTALADRSGNARLTATLTLMAWSLTPASGRNWRDYYPGRSVVDLLAWDAYDTAAAGKSPHYADPAAIFGPLVRTAAAEGLPFAIAETGSARIPGDAGSGRAAWLAASVDYLSRAGATYVAYFDLDWRSASNVDYRLTDEPSAAVWRSFCG